MIVGNKYSNNNRYLKWWTDKTTKTKNPRNRSDTRLYIIFLILFIDLNYNSAAVAISHT